jgi:c(7)-type cytochrome triheme protein
MERMLPYINKYKWTFLITGLLGLFLTVTLYAQPEEIWLDHPEGYKTKQRPEVWFPHETHMESFECLDCHHRYEDSENVLEEDELEEGEEAATCTACHDSKTKINLMQAFHRQCIDCHNQSLADEAISGPRRCGECHIRNQDSDEDEE